MSAKTVSSTLTTMSEIMQPGDANFLGKVFGGRLLSLIDLCAYTTASRFAESVTVTASFDRVDFHEPIEVGEVLTLQGLVSYVGRTSVEVTIEVFAEDIFKGVRRHTNTARVTMVALKDNRPTEVPRLICETREDKIRYLEGKLRRELRTKQREERDRLSAEFGVASEEELDRLLALERIS
ncbi:MAG TPA: acyl-CoA thioesterase [Fimbriimonadaceae bacterium]|nr:acyl-CoA thioesterase [Fimbriimonadaceae bacterium]